jgi:hypothetical protein
MKFLSLSALTFLTTFLSVSARDTCKPSPKVHPKLTYDFAINLVFGPSIDLGTNIYNAQQTYLNVVGGSFCAKWNNGTSGTIQPGGTASYYQLSEHVYQIEFEYLLKTVDSPPAYILVKQKGWEVDFIGRTQYALETGDARYSGLNTGVWTGVETVYATNTTGTFCKFEFDI